MKKSKIAFSSIPLRSRAGRLRKLNLGCLPGNTAVGSSKSGGSHEIAANSSWQIRVGGTEGDCEIVVD